MTASAWWRSGWIALIPICGIVASCASPGVVDLANQKLAPWVDGMRSRAAQYRDEGDGLLATGNTQAAIDRYWDALFMSAAMRGDDPLSTSVGKEGYLVMKADPDQPLRVGDVITRANDLSLAAPADEQAAVDQRLAWAKTLFDLNIAQRPTVTLTGKHADGAPFQMQYRKKVKLMYLEDADHRALVEGIHQRLVSAFARLDKPPRVSEQAHAAAMDAQRLEKGASDAESMEAAADRYRMATYLAPWWKSVYINYALFQKATEDDVGAVNSLQDYLTLAPNADDAPSIRKEIAEMQPKLDAQRRLMSWEGWWRETGKETGYRFLRQGHSLYVKFDGAARPYLKGTIVDDSHAEAVTRVARDTGVNVSETVDRCMNGALEASVSLALSPDKKTLIWTFNNEFDMYPNCQVARTYSSSTTYVR